MLSPGAPGPPGPRSAAPLAAGRGEGPIVEIRDLSYSYPARGGAAAKALDGVSLEVRRREIFGVLGPNGGGKTTLFKILSTLLAPGAGAVRVGGADVTADAAAVRNLLGVAFQSPSLDVKLTVHENLLHQGHLYGLRGSTLQGRIESELHNVGMASRARDRVETLSGGMRRRVELAKAMLHGPELLVLDEPSTGLDPGARSDLWDQLLRLRETGTTVLLTTHLMDEAARCDRLALIHRGRVVALGTPDALTSEIGGDVITVESDAAELVFSDLRGRFGPLASLLDGRVRLETRDGHRLIPQIVEWFPRQIRSIALSRPTLEDVFIRRTGHRLREDPDDAGGAR